MKLKQMVLVSCVALSLVFGGNAFAVDLAGALIQKIGVNPDVRTATTTANIIFVSHSSFTGNLQCVLSASLGDAGLATALTAMSLGNPVWLRVGSTNVSAVTTATIMYLEK